MYPMGTWTFEAPQMCTVLFLFVSKEGGLDVTPLTLKTVVVLHHSWSSTSDYVESFPTQTGFQDFTEGFLNWHEQLSI